MKEFKMKGDCLYSQTGHHVATAKGTDVYDERGHKVGYVRGEDIYNDRGHKIATVRRGEIVDENGHQFASAKDIAEDIEGVSSDTTAVALWLFFVKRGMA